MLIPFSHQNSHLAGKADHLGATSSRADHQETTQPQLIRWIGTLNVSHPFSCPCSRSRSRSRLSCQVINLEAMRPLTPRIEIFDHSQGRAAPAYALSPVISSLGSEYMFVGLGCGVVGVFSIATGECAQLHPGLHQRLHSELRSGGALLHSHR